MQKNVFQVTFSPTKRDNTGNIILFLFLSLFFTPLFSNTDLWAAKSHSFPSCMTPLVPTSSGYYSGEYKIAPSARKRIIDGKESTLSLYIVAGLESALDTSTWAFMLSAAGLTVDILGGIEGLKDKNTNERPFLQQLRVRGSKQSVLSILNLSRVLTAHEHIIEINQKKKSPYGRTMLGQKLTASIEAQEKELLENKLLTLEHLFGDTPNRIVVGWQPATPLYRIVKGKVRPVVKIYFSVDEALSSWPNEFEGLILEKHLFFPNKQLKIRLTEDVGMNHSQAKTIARRNLYSSRQEFESFWSKVQSQVPELKNLMVEQQTPWIGPLSNREDNHPYLLVQIRISNEPNSVKAFKELSQFINSEMHSDRWHALSDGIVEGASFDVW